MPDTITANGGVPLMNRVGHAFFKQRMRREGVLFGGEVTGHYYFPDNYYADTGFIPALLILELMSKKATMAELLEPLREQVLHLAARSTRPSTTCPPRWRASRQRFADGEHDASSTASRSTTPDWHFNVRPSNTEPLLRLNLGADGRELMEEKRDLVLGVIREGA